ncbi:MAG TPA: hypothetical protein VF614_08760 [Chthoniobacteraceae bacterium]|jgi:hypothetical protein
MKYLFLLATLVVGYYLLSRDTPVTAVTETLAETKAAPNISATASGTTSPSNALKRPLDRTNATLDQVKQRNGAGEF